MRFDTNFTVKLKDAYTARHEPEAARVLGEYAWMVMLGLISLAIVGSIAYGAREFFRPLSEEVESSVSVGARKGVTKTELVNILDALDARATEYELRRTAPVPVKDPS
jgi:hypothetical protein